MKTEMIVRPDGRAYVHINCYRWRGDELLMVIGCFCSCGRLCSSQADWEEHAAATAVRVGGPYCSQGLGIRLAALKHEGERLLPLPLVGIGGNWTVSESPTWYLREILTRSGAIPDTIT